MPQEQGPAVLSLIGGLLLFALILFLAWFCSRWIGSRYGFRGASGSIQVLERTAIGPDRVLMTVRAGGKVWLLGVTSHHIETIGELDPAQLPPEDSAAGEKAPEFSAALQNALKGWTGRPKREKGNKDE